MNCGVGHHSRIASGAKRASGYTMLASTCICNNLQHVPMAVSLLGRDLEKLAMSRPTLGLASRTRIATEIANVPSRIPQVLIMSEDEPEVVHSFLGNMNSGRSHGFTKPFTNWLLRRRTRY